MKFEGGKRVFPGQKDKKRPSLGEEDLAKESSME